MFNHSNEVMADWVYDIKRQGYVVTAQRNIKAGDEIFIRYTKDMDDTHLFMYYGFLSDPLQKIQVNLEVQLDQNDALFEEKLSELGGDENMKQKFSVT